MKPGSHIGFSVSLAFILWFFSRSIWGAVLCFFSGIILDIDHALEFIINHGARSFTLKRCYRASEHTNRGKGPYRFRKVHLFLHSFEILVLLWVVVLFYRNFYLFSFALGYALHIFLDLFGNNERFRFYFILWRAAHNFEADDICVTEPD